MQFAGQRTNELLEPIGEPDNILVKLADDVLPDPEAILIHRITPQQTLTDGISEADFTEFFHNKIAQANTVFVGYNNIRFDDEFIRFANYRSFYDPYEWHWKDGRGRWDLLDAMRIMRALRPEGLQWPFIDGVPTVKLDQMAKINGLIHENAHDALSDVLALIQLGQKFMRAQPKLFHFLIQNRDKKAVAKIAEQGSPIVYTSGKYKSEFLKTTVVHTVFRHPRREAAVVWDLRHNPQEWFDKTPKELAEHWAVRYGDDKVPLPLKTMQYNRCPALAPLSVLDEASKKRINYDDSFHKHYKLLVGNTDFNEKLLQALDILENEQQARLPLETQVDEQLYDDFWTDADRGEIIKIRQTNPEEFTQLLPQINNKRLRAMMPLYKARNFPRLLSKEEHEQWEKHRENALLKGGESSRVAKVYSRMQDIAKTRQLSPEDEYLLSELQLYVEGIVPASLEDS